MASRPLVSVVTVTKNRGRFLHRLIEQFLKQDYQRREMVIVAPPGDPVFDLDLLPGLPIYRFAFNGNIGQSRQFAVERSIGQYCIQFDDDDWQASHRVSAQVSHLQLSRKAVVGMFEMTFYREGEPHAWRVIDRVEHCAGAALAYRRDWAMANPFSTEPSPFAEDTDFVTRAIRQGQFSNATGLDLLVMNTHADCDSGRGQDFLPEALLEASDNWRKVPRERIAHILNA